MARNTICHYLTHGSNSASRQIDKSNAFRLGAIRVTINQYEKDFPLYPMVYRHMIKFDNMHVAETFKHGSCHEMYVSCFSRYYSRLAHWAMKKNDEPNISLNT